MRIKLERGLDIRIDGAPAQRIEGTLPGSRIALQVHDYPGLRPRLAVAAGDWVRAGDALFHDWRQPAIAFTSPASGRVVNIRRGAKRRVLEVVVAREGEDAVVFPSQDMAAI
ncbi:MAG: NADH:ubiquinone reductase (Na(+)-transporting) subunit A, partial [Halioglobus sp.]|nr:NADH:ubiquinone reductase (Na(+)-transporting) subunit A [Halioglobus sp.]